MIFKFILLSVMVVSILTQTPSTNTYLLGITQLIPTFDELNLFDGPSYISNASTTPTNNNKPTKDRMMYYNYYTAAVNCPLSVYDLSCDYCDNIKRYINQYKVIENSDYQTRALVALSISRLEIVVAYRATENLWNAVLDATFINYTPIQGSQIKIHQGFYIAVMSLYNDVTYTVKYMQTLCPTCKIVITGHSLGAAMARVTLFLWTAKNQFAGVEYEVYTFGEPRSGNQYYVDYLNTKLITTARITDRADIVPHLPPTSILNTELISDYYVHVQTEYWINGVNGQKFANQLVYEDPTCSSSLGPAYSGLDHFTYFDVDHLKCLGDATKFFEFPNALTSVVDIPPWPEYIVDGISDGAVGIITITSPILGR